MPKTFTSLIVSHQARLRCIMHMYGFGIMTAPAPAPASSTNDDNSEWNAIDENYPLASPRNIDKDYDVETIVVGGGPAKVGQVASFKNAAVIRLVITKDTVKASLAVSGIIDAKENKANYTYFVRPDEMGKSGAAYTEVPFRDNTTKNNFHDVGDDTYVFYLVRHGQAEHNVLKGFSKAFSSKDTSLTDAGETQASNSGVKLTSEIIKNDPEYKYPDFLFASDLKRTRQTLLKIMKGMPSLKEKHGTTRDIIILPCAHELKYKYDPESATCDAKQGAMWLPWAKTPNENISTCTRETCTTPGKINQLTYNSKIACLSKDGNLIYDNPIKLLYFPDFEGEMYHIKNQNIDFYSNHARATRPFIKSCLTCPKEPAGKRCRDTDMITQAIEHLASPNTSRMSLNTISKQDFFDNDDEDDDDGEDSEDDETTRETIRVNPIPSEYRNQYTKLGGKKRSKKTRRAVKTRRAMKTRRTRKHLTKKKKKHSNKRKGRKTRHKNKK